MCHIYKKKYVEENEGCTEIPIRYIQTRLMSSFGKAFSKWIITFLQEPHSDMSDCQVSTPTHLDSRQTKFVDTIVQTLPF